MRVPLAVLADYANVSREGKLNILGIFHTIHTKSFPCKHTQMCLVIQFEADIAEVRRKKKIEVQLMDDDGKRLFRIGGELTINEVKPGELFSHHQILTFQNLQFEKPGNYQFDVFVDNEPKRTVPLKVVKTE